MADDTKIIPVILCGGSGKRLWPLSRRNNPKQFLKLDGKKSLLHNTIERAATCADTTFAGIVTVTAKTLEHKTRIHLADLSPELTGNIIVEPEARNTAPAIMLAAQYIKSRYGEDSLMWILPSDHTVKNPQALKEALQKATSLACQNNIVTFGIKPQWPETGYGYIKTQNNKIETFTEKPDLKTARQYIQSGNYVWNSGMFLAPCKLIIEQLDKHAPRLLETGKSISFDKAVMEQTDKAATIECDIGWSDIGSWRALWRYKTG